MLKSIFIYYTTFFLPKAFKDANLSTFFVLFKWSQMQTCDTLISTYISVHMCFVLKEKEKKNVVRTAHTWRWIGTCSNVTTTIGVSKGAISVMERGWIPSVLFSCSSYSRDRRVEIRTMSVHMTGDTGRVWVRITWKIKLKTNYCLIHLRRRYLNRISRKFQYL